MGKSVRDIFWGYRNAVAEKGYIEAKLEWLRADVGAQAISYSGMPGSGKKSDPTSEKAIQIADKTRQLEAVKKRLVEQQIECEELIELLDNPTDKLILFLHFIGTPGSSRTRFGADTKFWSIEEIAPEINYSTRHAFRLYSLAIDKLDRICGWYVEPEDDEEDKGEEREIDD